MKTYSICTVALSALMLVAQPAAAATAVAYIHGDVAADGTIPSGAAPAFHQMLLTDTGSRGCSQFKEMVEAQWYSITQHYDATTTLNAAFLNQFHVIVFGLHQKEWSAPEKAALDAWIRDGGGILIYSDSAAGGDWQQVGVQNQTGQTAVNNILTQYGMQVAVDHGGGTRSYTSPADAANPVVSDQPELEGEGISPIAVDETTGAKVLIPCEDAFKTGGTNFTPSFTQGITIPYTRWAVLAHRSVDGGNVMAMFDRQPIWNDGEGSDINQKDNREILRRIVRFLTNDYHYPLHWLNEKFGPHRDAADEATVWGWNADADGDGLATLAELALNADPLAADSAAASPTGGFKVNPADNKKYLELTWRQWSCGEGTIGVDYTARSVVYRAEHSESLQAASWMSGAGVVEQVGSAIPNGDGTETVTVRFLPASQDSAKGFGRLRLMLEATP